MLLLASTASVLLHLRQIRLHNTCLAVHWVRASWKLLTATYRTSLFRSWELFKGDGWVSSHVSPVDEAPKVLSMTYRSCISWNVFSSEPSCGNVLDQLLLLQIKILYLIKLSCELDVSLTSLIDAFILRYHRRFWWIYKVAGRSSCSVVIFECWVCTADISTNIRRVLSPENRALLV